MPPKSLHQKARHRLRVAMKDKGHSARTFALATGLSRSLIEKLMSQESKRPSPAALAKIEDALSLRIWSSPATFRARKRQAELELLVQDIVLRDGIGLDAARLVAAKLFQPITPNQPMHHYVH